MAASRQRALVFLPYGNWGVNFATSLELAQRYLDDGWSVTLLRCDGVLDACDVKHEGAVPLACASCRAQQRSARRQLVGDVDEIVLSGADPRVDAAMATVPESFADVAELRALRHGGFELGEAALSSIASVWWLNTAAPDMHDPRVRRILRAQLRACLAVHLATLDAIAACGAVEGVAFNGRPGIMRAFVRACEAAGIDYWTHERGSDRSRFLRFRNGIRHSRALITADIERTCARVEPSERAAVASAYYADRRRGVSRAWRSYTGLQVEGLAPVVEGKRVVVVFTSTDTEFVGVGSDWDLGFYSGQAEAIARIAADLAERGGAHAVYVRIHPNTSSPAAVAELMALAATSPGVEVLPPGSPVDSYALMDRADRVVTFGSTMGIEAAYAGRVSVVAGPASYRGLGSTYEPASHEELIDLLVATDIRPLPLDGAVDFGYWLRTFGEPFRYAAEPELGRATFRGRSVDVPWFRALRTARAAARRARRALPA